MCYEHNKSSEDVQETECKLRSLCLQVVDNMLNICRAETCGEILNLVHTRPPEAEPLSRLGHFAP